MKEVVRSVQHLTSPVTTTTMPSTDLLILNRLSSSDCEIKLKAIRELKNQIIGNPTNKLFYINLGAVPTVTAALAQANADSDIGFNLIVQSAATLGSFACGSDAGVRAVLDAGAFPHLIRLLPDSHEKKVVDASARSLRMIYQSKLAPKYDFFQKENMEFLLSLLKSENENLTGLGASIVIHSCETSDEQSMLCYAGALEKLVSLLDGSISQHDASLESLAAILKNNPDAVSKFVDIQNGRALSSVIELTKDRYSRTKLLASLCLIHVNNSSSGLLQDIGIKTQLIYVLLELLDNPGKVGDEASFAFSSLIEEREDLQKLAFEANAIDKFCNHLQNCALHPKRLEGIFLALAGLCSKLECCRSKFLSLQVLNQLVDALTHDDAKVRTAACICLKSVSRSIKLAEHLEVLDPQRATLVREMYPIGEDTLYRTGILTCDPGEDYVVVRVPAPVGDPLAHEELAVEQPAVTADEDVEMPPPVPSGLLPGLPEEYLPDMPVAVPEHDVDYSISYSLDRLSLQVRELSDSFMDYAAAQEARGVRMEVQLDGIYQLLRRHFDHGPQQ